MKLLYFHVPKTAGSSINKFFSTNVCNYHFHIESIKNLDKTFCENYQFLSGHVSYNRMNNILDLNEWITFATFREPISYVISHLKWVRKLADPSEKERFEAHPEIFQKISSEMCKYDFSQANQISKFIEWLKEINFNYFHNTQTHYMHQTNNQAFLTNAQLEAALGNMRKIDFIGIQENLDDFMEMISYEFAWNLEIKPRTNVNENNYGFNINDLATQKALFPLYEKDLIVYKEAQDLFQKQQKLYENIDITDVIGYVDSITARKIIGWARFKNSLQKVKLELRINNQTIKITIANIFRQGLKTKNIHPSGLCAYAFILDNDIKDYSKCKVYVAGTDISLPMSR